MNNIPGSISLPERERAERERGTVSATVPVNGSATVPVNGSVPGPVPTSGNSNNKLNAQSLANIYDFLVSLNKKNNRTGSIDTLLKVNDLKMKHIIMYKYLITDSFNSKDHDTVKKCYKKLSELLLPNSPINRYIYALIVYIDVEIKFYSIKKSNINMNMNKINYLFKKSNPSLPPPPHQSNIINNIKKKQLREQLREQLISNNNKFNNISYQYGMLSDRYQPPTILPIQPHKSNI